VAAVCHVWRRACSDEPPGQAEAPIGVAQCPEHAHAARAVDGLAAGENRPTEPLSCLGATDQWGRGPLSATGCGFGGTALGALSVFSGGFLKGFPK
jgi:hypothetical protein